MDLSARMARQIFLLYLRFLPGILLEKAKDLIGADSGVRAEAVKKASEKFKMD